MHSAKKKLQSRMLVIEQFLADRPDIHWRHVGKLCLWNVRLIFQNGQPATELELHSRLQKIQKRGR